MDKVMDSFGVFDYLETPSGTYEYTAAEMRAYFAGIIGNGVLNGVGGQFAAAAEGLQVTIGTGEGWLLGVHGRMVDPSSYTLDPVVESMSKICSFVLDVDVAEQLMGITVLVGTQAASPSAPQLTQTEIRFQQLLWQARVHDDGTVTLTDFRTFITRPGDQLTPESIGAAKRPTMLTATLYAANWDEGVYELPVVGVSGPLTIVQLLPEAGADTEAIEMLQAANIQDEDQTEDVCILRAHGDVPTEDIVIRILVGGDVISV